MFVIIIVKLSPIKFSLGISLLVHGAIIGGAVWWGRWYHILPAVEVGEVATLELIAAQANPVESAATPPDVPALPIETVLPILAPPAPAAVAPVEVSEPMPQAEIIQPVAPIQPITEPQSVVQPSDPVGIAAPPAQAAMRGDSSSSLPGKDFTTAAGRPTAMAKPDYFKNPEPDYPIVARRRGQQGTVVLNVTVNTAGRATEISFKQSSGFDLLDQAALRAVRAWEFQPARVGAMRVESKIEVPVRFKLTN